MRKGIGIRSAVLSEDRVLIKGIGTCLNFVVSAKPNFVVSQEDLDWE